MSRLGVDEIDFKLWVCGTERTTRWISYNDETPDLDVGDAEALVWYYPVGYYYAVYFEHEGRFYLFKVILEHRTNRKMRVFWGEEIRVRLTRQVIKVPVLVSANVVAGRAKDAFVAEGHVDYSRVYEYNRPGDAFKVRLRLLHKTHLPAEPAPDSGAATPTLACPEVLDADQPGSAAAPVARPTPGDDPELEALLGREQPWTRVRMVISGGQTGVDYAALSAAQSLGIATGGLAPHEFRTRPQLATFNLEFLKPCASLKRALVCRSRANVDRADATLILQRTGSETPGTMGTIGYCRTGKWGAPSAQRATPDAAPYRPHLVIDPSIRTDWDRARRWLRSNEVRLLNVAGSRDPTRQAEARAALKHILV